MMGFLFIVYLVAVAEKSRSFIATTLISGCASSASFQQVAINPSPRRSGLTDAGIRHGTPNWDNAGGEVNQLDE